MSAAKQAFKKLPPHIQRDILRHVAPSEGIQLKSKAVAMKELREEQKNGMSWEMKKVIGQCFLLTGLMGCVPLIFHERSDPLNTREGALTAGQIRRGAFLNSGSNDVGRDENWDFTKNRPKPRERREDNSPVVLPNGRILSSEEREKLRLLSTNPDKL